MTAVNEYLTAKRERDSATAALSQEATRTAQAADKATKVADDSIEALLNALQKACPAVATDVLTARKLAKEARQKAEDAVEAFAAYQKSIK